MPEGCPTSSDNDYLERANELLDNRYLLSPHPIVTLPANPTWAEDPLRDPNWQFQFHSLRFVLFLFEAWLDTGNDAYRDRALFLLQDWIHDNKRDNPPSPYSWQNHSTAWRAMVLACTSDLVGMPPWLRASLELHGETLADPSFYVGHGNHALNQAIGLLEVGRALGRSGWIDLARDRINTLVAESVDRQGVTNEQSVGYQRYNYERYEVAFQRLTELGLATGPEAGRVELMPRLLALATLPTGNYTLIGDTEADSPPSVPGTWLEFVASQGASGPTPPLVRSFTAGYLFARSGWGATRSFTDETALSVRWGPGTTLHGHPDGTSLTLAAWGSRLIVGPGKYTYTPGTWRDYFRGRRANNVVTVDGLKWHDSAPTRLLGQTVTSRLVDVRLRTKGYSGVTDTRRITWSRGMDYILVEDRLASASAHTYRQTWHLVEDADLAVGKRFVRTTRLAGNVMIRELIGSPTLRVVTGARHPLQGWVSYQYGTKVTAPVVEAIRRGSNVRYLTIIVPSQGRPRAQVSDLHLTSDGYRLTITIGDESERVVASGPSISIKPLAAG